MPGCARRGCHQDGFAKVGPRDRSRSSETTLLLAIGRDELGLSRLPVRVISASEMRCKVLDVRRPSRTVRGDLLERKPTLLQHRVGLVTFSNEFDLDHGFIVVPSRHGDQQPRGASHTSPFQALPAAGEPRPERATQLEVAVYLYDPATAAVRSAPTTGHRSVLERPSMRTTGPCRQRRVATPGGRCGLPAPQFPCAAGTDGGWVVVRPPRTRLSPSSPRALDPRKPHTHAPSRYRSLCGPPAARWATGNSVVMPVPAVRLRPCPHQL